MMAHPNNFKLEVHYGSCLVVFAILGLLLLAAVIIAAGSAVKPVVEALR